MIKYDTYMRRNKIAITVKDDILKRLDRAIDGKTIRNRSHAIEYFLNQALGTKVEKALIIAGEKNPSCLTVFEGKTVVEYEIELLKTYGITDIVLLLHKNEKEVQRMLGDGSKHGLKIHYEMQNTEKIGTAHAVSRGKKVVGEDLFFVLYCDVVAQVDLADFAAYHRETGMVATIALTSIKDPSLYGSVRMRGEKIVGFEEKPQEKDEVSRVISAGMFCFGPEIFDAIPVRKDASLEKDVFPKLAKEGRLGGYMFEGEWCNVRNRVCYGEGKKK